MTLRRVRAIILVVEKQLSITHCECVFVALGIQREMLMRQNVVCDMPGSTILCYIFSYIV